MNLKLIVGILLIAAVPAVAQTQKPNVAKVTKAGAQKVIKTISSDKGKNQTYCDIGKLGAQIDEAEQKKDMKKIDELNQKMEELAAKLGPEYVSLMDGLQDIDPDSKDAQEIGSMLEALDKSCAK
jgi:peptidoglycan hydrolase CwlO-like protein